VLLQFAGIRPLLTRFLKHHIEEGSITAVIAFPKRLQHLIDGVVRQEESINIAMRIVICTSIKDFVDTEAAA
jgi:hypothetical protein